MILYWKDVDRPFLVFLHATSFQLNFNPEYFLVNPAHREFLNANSFFAVTRSQDTSIKQNSLSAYVPTCVILTPFVERLDFPKRLF